MTYRIHNRHGLQSIGENDVGVHGLKNDAHATCT